MTREEAIKKGYLSRKKVYLKPVPRKGKMVNDPAHSAYFMYEGAFVSFVLPTERKRKILVNPFKSTEEKEFFEKELDIDLNPYKKENNFWSTFRVKFQKDPTSMHTGVELDLSDPVDNLRWRVLNFCPEVAPSWDERLSRPTYRFALVDESYEENKASQDMDEIEEMFSFYGEIKNSLLKMRNFLDVYFMETRQLKEAPLDADKSFLQKEIKNAMDEDKKSFLRVIQDEDYEMKLFIVKCIRAGAIEKKGVNRYDVVGDVAGYKLPQLVNYLKKLKETTDDVYLRLEAQTRPSKKAVE